MKTQELAHNIEAISQKVKQNNQKSRKSGVRNQQEKKTQS